LRVGRGILGVTALVVGASVAAAVAASFAVAAETSGAEGPAPAQVSPGPSRPLVVCADPNNLPFSNRAGQGFENRITALLAKDMKAKVEFVWWAQRRGFVRNTLGEAKCDLWPGVATGLERVAATRPYYRSTYVFVTRADKLLQGLTLDDPRLRSLSIGVQMVGNDSTNTPPAHALSRRGLTQNVRGYMLYGDYNRPNPPAAIIDAVGRGDIDVGVAWGPLAGYFSSRSPVSLRVEPVTPEVDATVLPMTFDISMGVRRDEPELQGRINGLLAVHQLAIEAILHEFHVPLVPRAASGTSPAT
jgi:quinoprotein dehydrogenase-associated probable ABC transporter substrate-binding protein